MANYENTIEAKAINDWLERCDPIIAAKIKDNAPSRPSLAEEPRIEIATNNSTPL